MQASARLGMGGAVGRLTAIAASRDLNSALIHMCYWHLVPEVEPQCLRLSRALVCYVLEWPTALQLATVILAWSQGRFMYFLQVVTAPRIFFK